MLKKLFNNWRSADNDHLNQFAQRINAFFEKYLPEDEKREGYQAPIQNRLKFLGNERLLKRLMLFSFIGLVLIENYMLNAVLATSFKQTIQTATDQLQATGAQIDVRPSFFALAFNIFSHPFIKLVLFSLTAMFLYTLYIKIHDSYRPLEYDLTQGTTTAETTDKMRKDYPSVEIKINAPAPAYVKGTIGVPIRKYPQTEDQKARGVIEYAVATEPTHVIALAHTRAGKGIYLIDPAIYIGTGSPNQAERRSIIYLATAGDEPRRWYSLLEARGYRIRILNVLDPSQSDPYPMFSILVSYYRDYYQARRKADECRRNGLKEEAMHWHVISDKAADHAMDEVTKISQIIMPDNKASNDGFWVTQSRILFRAIALALCEQTLDGDPQDPVIQKSLERNFSLVNGYTIQNVVNKMFNETITTDSHDYLLHYADENTKLMDKLITKYEGQSALAVFFGEMDDELIAKDYFMTMIASKDAKQTLGNIVSNFNGDLEWFMRSSIAKMTAANDNFSFDDLAYDTETPTALFIMMSDGEPDNNGLGFLAYEQIYQRLNFRAFMNDEEVFPRDVWSFNDEAGNTGKVLNLTNKWTASLKKHFFIFFIIQGLEQITALYDKSTLDTIVGNTGILYYIRSGSKETNEYISASIGERAVFKKRRNVSGILDFNVSRSEEVERIPILKPFELRELPEGSSVVLRLMHTKDQEGNGIYQKPIINRPEDHTDSIPFYEWCQLGRLKWSEIPLNNQFLEISRKEMQWQLRPRRSKAPVTAGEDQTKQVIEMQKNTTIKAVAKSLKVKPVLIDGDRQPTAITPEVVEPIGDTSSLVDEKEALLAQIIDVLGTQVVNQPYKVVFNVSEQMAIRNIIDQDGGLFRDTAVNNEYGTLVDQGTVDAVLTFIASNFTTAILQEVSAHIKQAAIKHD